MIVSRDFVPKVPRWTCAHPGCNADAAVHIKCGPIGASTYLCAAHDRERFPDLDPPPRLVRAPTRASLAVGGTLVLIGAVEATAAVAAVAWCRAADMLAPTWAATFWSTGILVGAIGLVALVVLMLVERIVETRPR